MFALLALIQKQFSLNRKMSVAFIDFGKAFNSINRKLLWAILLKMKPGKNYTFASKACTIVLKLEFDVDLS